MTGWGGRRPNSGRKSSSRRPEGLPRNTFCIYVVCEEKNEEVCKIGISRWLGNRFTALQSGNWRRLRLFAAYELPDLPAAVIIEDRLHTHFASVAIRAEWFKISPSMAREAMEKMIRAYGVETSNIVAEVESPPFLKIINMKGDWQ